MAADNGAVLVYDDRVNVAKFFQAALDVLELGVSRLEFLAGGYSLPGESRSEVVALGRACVLF